MTNGYPQPVAPPPYGTYPLQPSAAAPRVDYGLVRRLRIDAAARIQELERAHGRAVTREAAQSEVIELAAGAQVSDPQQFDATVNAILDLLFGAGRLQPLLDDPAIENIDINGKRVFVQRFDDPHPVEIGPVAEGPEELVDLIRTLASGITTGTVSRPWDEANPEVDFSQPGGLRFSGLMSVTGDGPVVSIRRNRLASVQLRELQDNGTVTEQCANFLRAAVAARRNLIVAGETNSGKTTLLRALINAVNRNERLITVENARELGVDRQPDLHPNAISLEVRPANSEGLGGLGMRALVRRSLRMNPSRVIVGEVLGDEIVEMLKAMTQGNRGSMSTLHAERGDQVFERIAIYARQGPENLPTDVVHEMIASALDFVIYIRRARTAAGHFVRFVSEIREVNGFDGRVQSSQVFAPGPDGRAVPRAAISCLDELVEHGYDPAGGYR